MLGVESLTELHTTLFGWHQYNVLWDILTQTGLVFLPFFVIIFQSFIETVKSQYTTQAAFTSLRRVELDLIGMLTIIVLAGQPLLPLHPQELTFVPLCGMSEKSNASQLQKVVQKTPEVPYTKVPLWWYAVMAVSEGVTHAAKRSIPCVADMHLIFAMINELRIEDPFLRRDLEKFAEECYLPTLHFDRTTRLELSSKEWDSAEYRRIQFDLFSRYDKGKIITLLQLTHQDLSSPRVQKALENMTSGLTEWMGSEVYLRMPGPHFYQGRFISKEYQTIGGKRFRPTCAQAWNGFMWDMYNGESEMVSGLYQHLKNLIDSDPRPIEEILMEAVLGTYSNPVTERLCVSCTLGKANMGSDENFYRWILMRWLPTLPFLSEQNLYPSLNQNSPESIWKNVSSLIGVAAEKLKLYPMMYLVQQAAPVAQALVLMSLYLMLPVGLVLSGFNLEFLLVGAVGIFTLKFMSYFFHLAAWLNLYLLKVMGATFASILGEWVTPIVIITMFFAMPLLFVSMLVWAGFEVTGAYERYSQVGGEDSTLAKAGRSGVRIVGQVVEAGLSIASAGATGLVKTGLKAARVGIRSISKGE